MGYIGIPSKICPSLPFGGYTPYQMELFVLVVLFRKDREENALPIGSMYAIYGNIYHQYTPNVSIYHTWILWVMERMMSQILLPWLQDVLFHWDFTWMNYNDPGFDVTAMMLRKENSSSPNGLI